jgi:hypothetical protein
MDPLTEAWSFNLQIAPIEEDLALSARGEWTHGLCAQHLGAEVIA